MSPSRCHRLADDARYSSSQNKETPPCRRTRRGRCQEGNHRRVETTFKQLGLAWYSGFVKNPWIAPRARLAAFHATLALASPNPYFETPSCGTSPSMPRAPASSRPKGHFHASPIALLVLCQTCQRLHSGRITRRDRHHRRVGLVAPAGGPIRTRSGPTHARCKQPETNCSGLSQFRRYQGLPSSWPLWRWPQFARNDLRRTLRFIRKWHHLLQFPTREACGQSFLTQVFTWEERNETGPMAVKLWRANDVPGRMLRQEISGHMHDSIEEIVEIKRPQI